MGEAVEGPDRDGEEQALDLVAGKGDEVVRTWPVGVFVGADDGEEGVGEHGEGDPAASGGVAADLVLVEPGQALLGLKGLLHSPIGSQPL
ncbi:hypothetical protein OHA77_23950 [Streptosporangium sp. NBC_01639]|nr:hypothetical protein OHA77_23950 [Streptosporangium sp. NBC_01639]